MRNSQFFSIELVAGDQNYAAVIDGEGAAVDYFPHGVHLAGGEGGSAGDADFGEPCLGLLEADLVELGSVVGAVVGVLGGGGWGAVV